MAGRARRRTSRAAGTLGLALLVAACGADAAIGAGSGPVARDTAGADATSAARGARRTRLLSSTDAETAADDEGEPTHDGRPLSWWLDALATEDGRDWRALRAVEAMGRPGIAGLLERFTTLADDDPRFDATFAAVGILACGDAERLDDVLRLAAGDDALARRRALGVLARYCWNAFRREAEVLAVLRPLLHAPDAETRALTLRSLDRLRDGALPAAEDVLALSWDRDASVRAAVLDAHLSAAPGWEAMVLRALADPVAEVRAAACEDARRTGWRHPREVIDRLVATLDDPVETVRATAAFALGQAGGGAPDVVVPALVAAAQDEARGIRRQALGALVLLHRGADVPVPSLVESIGDEDLRWSAVQAMAQHAPADVGGGADRAAAVAALVDATADAERCVRADAARALLAVAPGEDAAFAAVERLTRDPDDVVRDAALAALTPYGLRGAPALGALLGDTSAALRGKAQEALVALGRDATPAVLALLDAGDSSALRRVGALRVLRETDPAAAAWRAGAWLSDDDPAVRVAALRVIGAAPAEAARVSDTLAARLADADEDVRAAALAALARVPDGPTRHVRAVVERLTDPDDGVRAAAAYAVGRLDPRPDDVRRALRSALGDAAPRVRAAAAEALVTTDRDVAVPVLARLVADGTGGWWPAAVLAREAPESRAALDGLIGGLRSRDEETRDRAAECLGELGDLASPAIPVLLALLARDVPAAEFTSHDVCPEITAAEALHAIAPDDPRVRAGLERAAASDDRWLRDAAKRLLAPASAAESER